MFKSIGWVEILIILGVLMLLFGGAKLPSMGKSLGKSLREFKSGVTGSEEQDREKTDPPQSPSSPPTSAGSGSTHRH